MICKNPHCTFERGHKGPCSYILARREGATNTATNRIPDATNTKASCVDERGCVEDGDSGRLGGGAVGAGASVGGEASRTLNRRRRSDYNAYQRELMRKRRAEKKAGFIGVAYG